MIYPTINNQNIRLPIQGTHFMCYTCHLPRGIEQDLVLCSAMQLVLLYANGGEIAHNSGAMLR